MNRICIIEFSIKGPLKTPTVQPTKNGPVGLGCRIHRLHLQRSKNSPRVSRYDTKQSDGKVPVTLDL